MTPNQIECSACHSTNPLTAKHCSNCGTRLAPGGDTIPAGTILEGPGDAAKSTQSSQTGQPLGSNKQQYSRADDATILTSTPPPSADATIPEQTHGAASDATVLDGVSAPFDDATVMAGAGPGDATDIGGAAAGWSRPVALPRASLNVGNLRPGTKLGTRYEIVQMLGQGGMGAVYKAMDQEIGRMVALKVIKPELALNEEILQRFKQELIFARRITHKSVIRIFDLGEADGVKFITMEFIEGKDLKSVVTEKGRLSFEECADIVSQICTALEAAHAEGVVHRDLKPQNVMVDKSGRVIVMDFGIARTMEPGSMTQTGALLGTPDYMSPEQVMGEHVDPRSDLFTLGVIFYELLVGALPYKADTVSAAMYKRTKEIPPRPIEVDPTVPP